MGSTAVRDLFGVASGEIQMSDGYGASGASTVAAIRYNEWDSGSAVDTVLPDDMPYFIVTNGVNTYSNQPTNSLQSMIGGVAFGNKNGRLAVYIATDYVKTSTADFNTVINNAQCYYVYKGSTAISQTNSQVTSPVVDLGQYLNGSARSGGNLDKTFRDSADQWYGSQTGGWVTQTNNSAFHIGTVDDNNNFPDKDETWKFSRINCVYGTVESKNNKVRLVISNNVFTMYTYRDPYYSTNQTCDSTLCTYYDEPTTSDLYYTLSWTWDPSTSRFSGTNFHLLAGWTGQEPSSSRHEYWYANQSYYTAISLNGSVEHSWAGLADSDHKIIHPHYNADWMWMGEAD